MKGFEMTERYWEADDGFDELLDFVNENVIQAIKGCWEDNPPVPWVERKDDRLVMVVGGPGKPTDEDPSGNIEIYTLTIDLLEELDEYSAPYVDIGGPQCDAHREDMRERAAALRKLADDVTALADRAAKAG